MGTGGIFVLLGVVILVLSGPLIAYFRQSSRVPRILSFLSVAGAVLVVIGAVIAIVT